MSLNNQPSMAGTVGANQANSAAHQAAGQESTFDISKLVAEAITKASSSTSTVPQTQANLTPKMVQLRFDSTPVHINGQNTSPGATTYREPREEGELTDSDDDVPKRRPPRPQTPGPNGRKDEFVKIQPKGSHTKYADIPMSAAPINLTFGNQPGPQTAAEAIEEASASNLIGGQPSVPASPNYGNFGNIFSTRHDQIQDVAKTRERVAEVDYDVTSGRMESAELGKSNNFLYKTSLCNFEEFVDLPLLFQTYYAENIENLNESNMNKEYFKFLTSIVPSILECYNPQNERFYKHIHHTILRCPDAFNQLVDEKVIYPEFLPPKRKEFVHGKLYAFPLTVEEVNKLLPTESEMASNLHQFNASTIKKDLINWYYLRDTMNPLKISLEEQYNKIDGRDDTQKDQKDKLKEQMDLIDQKMKSLETLIKNNETRLSEVSDLKEKHHHHYPIPKLDKHTNDDFNTEEAVFRISYFNNDGTIKFSEFYDKLMLYAKKLKLTEKGVLDLLGTLLKDEPFQVFMEYNNDDSDLETVIKALSARYNDRKNISEYQNMLRNISRKPSEPLRSAMSRALCLISLTSSLVPKSDRESRRKFLQQEYLIKLASPRAKRAISHHIKNAQREGLPVIYDTLLNIAVDTESDETPVGDLSLLAAPADRGQKLAEIRKNRQPSPIRPDSQQWRRSRSTSVDSISPSPTSKQRFGFEDRDLKELRNIENRSRPQTRQQTQVKAPVFTPQSQGSQQFDQSRGAKQKQQYVNNSYKLPFTPPPPQNQHRNQSNLFNENVNKTNYDPRSQSKNRQNSFQQKGQNNFQHQFQRSNSIDRLINRQNQQYNPNAGKENFRRQQNFQFGNGNNFNAQKQPNPNFNRQQSGQTYHNKQYAQKNSRDGRQRAHVLQTLQLSPSANQFYQRIGLNVPIFCNYCRKLHFAFDNCQQSKQQNFNQDKKVQNYNYNSSQKKNWRSNNQ